MRATSARRPVPSFVYRADADPAVAGADHTYISGNDIYSTQFAGFGDYALAFGVGGATSHGRARLPYVVSGTAGAGAARRRRRWSPSGSSPRVTRTGASAP